MRKLATGAAFLAGLGVLILATTALATMSSGVTTVASNQGKLDPINVKAKNGGDWEVEIKTEGRTSLAVSEIHVAPGGSFGWHSHPGPSLVIVKSGTSTFYRGDDPTCTGETHPAGTAYVDPGGVVHTARNESATEELVIFATRLIPDGVAPRKDEPNPGNCSF
jgi:quercetin dioxygenase-like cupin family protein